MSEDRNTQAVHDPVNRVAIVGMACRYPDADSPGQLWDNILAGRRAFRRLPPERMRLDDYWSPDQSAPDRFYARHAAVIEGYSFDRVRYRVAGSTYRSTDLTHWLALDVAASALADAGFPDGDELPRERTGVVVGNTLTGEFARANLMRLRWPYVRRTLAAALREEGWDDQRLGRFLTELEHRYKAPFPPVDEDSLAGGLSNTIAGRICNYFDLKGGGYTVDGACSSSLLSVVTACRALGEHELDVAIAGGVDLSIDPFEMVGFAKTGALATGEMRVYDRQSSGFWAGEGCGMVVLMREPDARAAGLRIYATIPGWGVSSDGKGGITRPEVAGYRLVLRRAYRRAGFGVETVSLFEGHGTGTPVGNDTELRALAAARREAAATPAPAAIGSIKAMIGHTKAAAGVAGLIKAVLAVHHEVLPPTVGCLDPHPLLRERPAALRVLPVAEPWPGSLPVRAGITAMGFGGINTHVIVENPQPRRRTSLPRPLVPVSRLAAGGGAELLVLADEDPVRLQQRVEELAGTVARLSYAELGDLAAAAQRQVGTGCYRAAVVAGSPDEAERRLLRLAELLAEKPERVWEPATGVFAGRADGPARIGFLFPGQGSGDQPGGGALRHRFALADDAFARARLPHDADVVATEVAQPRIAAGAVAGLRVLESLGIEATAAVGHSLGELAALHWAGSIDADTLLRLAELRGRTMTELSDPGTMASIAAGPAQVEPLLDGTGAVIAGYNSPEQTVVAGSAVAIRRVCERATTAGLGYAPLPVSHAFHSPLVGRSAVAFARHLAAVEFSAPARRVASTVTGEWLEPATDLPALLERQITEPVRFAAALELARAEADLFIEVGPGSVLSRLAAASGVRALSIDSDSTSLGPLCAAIAAAFVAGAPVHFAPLLSGRPDRTPAAVAQLRFFASPCETAPEDAVPPPAVGAPAAPGGAGALRVPGAGEVSGQAAASGAVGSGAAATSGEADMVTLVRSLVAARAELPEHAVDPDSLLLDDLHLSSITVGQVFVQAAQQLGLPPGQAPTSFATATLRDMSTALEELRQLATSGDADQPPVVAGVRGWVHPFVTELVPAPPPPPAAPEAGGRWSVFAPADHPLAEPLRRELERARVGAGVVVCLPPDCQQSELELALRGAQAAVGQAPDGRFLLVQHGRGGAAIARTARLEAPHLRTTVVDTPPATEAVGRIVADVAATTGFLEVHYDAAGQRSVPRLRPLFPQPAQTPPLDRSDLLLVTGGGRGITAECALALAVDSGARLAVLGRADGAADPEVAANLVRMRDAGVAVRYEQVDVTDPAAVRTAVDSITSAWGPVTAILHGAGGNEPAALSNLEPEDLHRTLAPKLGGLAALLDAVDPAALRLLVTFGSIIGRAGLRGEAHYAAANDWLADATVATGQRLPGCRAICLEWSVWAGTGMGERLSVIQSLIREGITPITVDQGVATLRQLLADPDLPPVIVVTGRAEGVDTITFGSPELPLLRFVDRPLVYYPGVELVVETTLSPGSDPYLDDHELDGNLLFPAVLGLEAMAQVASALREGRQPLVFERVEFLRPIVVPPGGETTIRIAALRTGPEEIEVAIRSAETGYGADHFRAALRPGGALDAVGAPEPMPVAVAPVALQPADELYGDLLFQGERFRRLERYRRVAARHAEAVVATREDRWFASFLPADLLLGDPGARDALMHGLQVCVPDATLLPGGLERLQLRGDRPAVDRLTFAATERGHEGDTYVYDIAVRAPDGSLVERWDGLRLHAVRKRDGSGPWPPPVLGPYLQRQVEHLLGIPLAVVVEPGAAGRTATAAGVRRALGADLRVWYRPDGRPEVSGQEHITASHGAGVTLLVASPVAVGCDVEPVVSRPEPQWNGLVHPHGALLDLLRRDESLDLAATRLWCALEALQKCGQWPGAPLSAEPRTSAGWTVLRAGDVRVATFVTSLAGFAEPVVLAIAARGEEG